MDDFGAEWTAARARMADGIETMLCFDFGMSGVELFRAASWVLDSVIRPEFERAKGITTEPDWCVKTMDAAFNIVVVKSGMTELEAGKLLGELDAHPDPRRHWCERL